MNSLTFINRRAILIATIHLIISLLVLNFHELWRDELQMWMIGVESNSFLELLKNKDPDHPYLWYIIIYFIQLFTSNYFVLQLFNVIINSASVYLVNRYSPFSKIQNLLFSFSYFILFEYNIITRNYSLVLFLLLLFCTLFFNWKRNKIGIALILIIMSNYHVNGLILSSGLSLLLLLKAYKDKHYTKSTLAMFSFSALGIAFPAITVGIGSLAMSHYRPYIHSTVMIDNIKNALRSIFSGVITIPNFFKEVEYWGSNIIDLLHSIPFLLVTSLFIFFLYKIIFKQLEKDPEILIYLIVTSGVFFFLISFIRYGAIRNHGFYFFIIFSSLWMFKKKLSLSTNRLLNFILVCQLISSITFISYDIIKPFSSSKRVAQYLDNYRLKNSLTITGGPDYTLTPIVAQMKPKTKFFNIQRRENSSYIDWMRPESPSAFQLLEIKEKEYISINSKTFQWPFQIQHLSKFTDKTITKEHLLSTNDAIVYDEDYDVFKITKSDENVGSFIEIKKNFELNEDANKNIDIFIDSLRSTNQFLYVRGWARCKSFTTSKEKYLIVNDEKDNNFLAIPETITRPDVVDATGDSINLHSGFLFRIDKFKLSSNNFDIYLILVDERGKYVTKRIQF